MSLKRIFGLYNRLNRALSSIWTKSIYYVTDKANWSFYWDGYYITLGLRERLGLCAHVIDDPWRLKRQIIHFGDRYAYLGGPFSNLHPSNHVFLTWFHGDPADSNPEMQNLFAALPEAAGYVEKIVVTCRISRQVLVNIGIPESKITTIPLGVDLAKFFRPTQEYRLDTRDKLAVPKDVICIGSFQKDGVGWEDGRDPKLVKGPDVFLEVIENLNTHYKNLLILLTGPARGYVKQGLERLRVPYIHHFLSHYQDIVRYYHALDLYIITSRCEGGPKSLLESWATGVPVVSTKVGVAADIIQHGKNGLLAETEDVRSLTDHATELIENASLRDACRRQALEDVKQFDWPIIAEQYYKQLYRPFLK